MHSVVCLSSVAHRIGGTTWELSASGRYGHRGDSSYPDSKLAMVLFAKVEVANVFDSLLVPPMMGAVSYGVHGVYGLGQEVCRGSFEARFFGAFSHWKALSSKR